MFSTVVVSKVPDIAINWSPDTIQYGEASTLTWSSSGASNCSLDGNNYGKAGAWVGANRTKSVTTVFSCVGIDGTTKSLSARLTVEPPPAIAASLSWNPQRVEYDGTSILTWSSNNAVSCKVDGVNYGTTGSWVGKNRIKNALSQLKCVGIDGTIKSLSARLTVEPPPAITASISWNPQKVEYDGTSILAWSSNNAVSCKVDGVNYGTTGSWVGKNRIKNALSQLKCLGIDGTTKSLSARLTVEPPPAITASISWNPQRVEYDGTSILTWSSSNTTSCDIDGESYGTSGSWVGTNRTQNAETQITCVGPAGNLEPIYAKLEVIAMQKNDVYVQVPVGLGGQYLKIIKAGGEWGVEELSQSHWDSEAQPNPDTGFNSQHLKLYQVEDTWHIEEITQLEWDELTL